jgi:hypothetical protein
MCVQKRGSYHIITFERYYKMRIKKKHFFLTLANTLKTKVGDVVGCIMGKIHVKSTTC